jgi:hypothetical protein
MSGAAGTLTISTTITSSVQVGYRSYGGVYSTGSVIITDSGAVVVASAGYAVFTPDGTVINYGLISNTGALGIREQTNYRGTDGLDENFGTITSDGTGISMSGSLFNSGKIIGTLDYGVAGRFTANITNIGEIYGGKIGVTFNGGGNLITNSGSIGGGIDGVFLDTSKSGSLELINGGEISGGTDAIYIETGVFGLTVDPGAAFSGIVNDHAGTGQIMLAAGTQAGSLDMDNTFVGFTGIRFASGATWSVRGSTVELTAGEKIAGFQAHDTLIVEGFAATGKSFVYGTGLTLSNATASETLALNTKYLNEFFSIYTEGGNTTIVAKQAVTPPQSIISTLALFQVNPGSGNFSQNFTIAATGTVSFNTGPALLNGEYTVRGTILNHGVILTEADTFAVHLEDDTLKSNGTITGADGAFLDGGRMTNLGSISGTAGIGVQLNASSLANSGYISGKKGVYSIDGKINNSGSISGTGEGLELENTSLSNSGQISGSADGVYIKGNGSVFDEGAISGASNAIASSGILDLTIDPSATFKGAVRSAAGSLLTLGGTSAGHLNIESFTGFSTIDLATASIWSLEGSTTQLASKQAILGFSYGDTIMLDGFVATGKVFANNELILQAGSTLETLDISGSFSTSSFIITDTANATDISLVNPAIPAHTAIVTISEAPAMQFIAPHASPGTASTAAAPPTNRLAIGLASAAQWHSLAEYSFTAALFGRGSFASGQNPGASVNPTGTAALSAGVQSAGISIQSSSEPAFAQIHPWVN